MRNTVDPLWEFFIHVLVGTGIFLLITVPAVGLNFLVLWLEALKTNDIIVDGLKFAEYFLFLADLLLFSIFVGRTVWRTAKKF